MFLSTVQQHGGGIVSDLGIVLAAAAIVALIFHRFKLPVIFGYILCGILLGPNLFPHSAINDLHTVNELSELGVIFLLFYIGLEFDLRKLQSLFIPAMTALVLQTIAMILLIMFFTPMLQWSPINSIFLGSLLAISSSMVTIQVLRSQGRIKHPHAQLAISILILEDILAILILVVLSGVAASGKFEWGSVWKIIMFIGIFIVGIFYSGKLVAHRLINYLNKIGSLELITIFSIGIALGLSVLAHKFQFSMALGAFMGGAILSQSPLSDMIEKSNRPMRDVFSAIFFVSIGMLIKPELLLQDWKWIIVLSFFVLIGKILACWLGPFLGGHPSRSAFKSSIAKSQIGEFSFIIAGLGQTLGVTDERLLSFAVGIALITILTTPILSKNSESLFLLFSRFVPKQLLVVSQFYRSILDSISVDISNSQTIFQFKRPAFQIFRNFFIINGIILVAYFLANKLQNSTYLNNYALSVQSITWLCTALLLTPFLIGMIRNLNEIIMQIFESTFQANENDQQIKFNIIKIFQKLTLMVLIIIVGGIYLSASAAYFPSGTSLLIFLSLICIVVIFFRGQISTIECHLEQMFIRTFEQKTETKEEIHRKETFNEISKKYPWPVKLCEAKIAPGTVACGQRIKDFDLRNQTGCTIIAVEREKFNFIHPSPEFPIFQGDKLTLLGTESQNKKSQTYLASKQNDVNETKQNRSIKMDQVYLGSKSMLNENTLAAANIRKNFGVNVIGLQRGAEQITSPQADELLKSGDVLYVIGDENSINKFIQHNSTAENTG